MLAIEFQQNHNSLLSLFRKFTVEESALYSQKWVSSNGTVSSEHLGFYVDAMLALCMSWPCQSVRLSLCLSVWNKSVLCQSKRLNLSLCKKRRTTPRDLVF